MSRGRKYGSVAAAPVAMIVVALAAATPTLGSTTRRAPRHHRLLADHAVTYQGSCKLVEPHVNGHAQPRWTQHHTLRVFRGRVSFDGITFRNRGRRSVRVTAHCQPTHHRARVTQPTVGPSKPKTKTHPKPTKPANKPTKPAPKPIVTRHVQFVAASDQANCSTPGWDPRPFMAAHGANIYRLIGPDDVRLARCAANIDRYGIRLYVSLRFDASLPPAQVGAQVSDALKQTGPVWAFSINNEPDMNEGNYGTPTIFEHDWRAAEPVLAHDDPSALRVFAEAGPWAVKSGWLAQALKLGHRGAQAVAQHCYDVKGGGINTAVRAAEIARSYELPDWCSEMSPASNPHLGVTWVDDSATEWSAKVQAVMDAAPDLCMTSWYEWPAIGAITR